MSPCEQRSAGESLSSESIQPWFVISISKADGLMVLRSALLSLGALDVHLVDDRLRPLAEQLPHRHPDDLPVEPERPVVDVPRIELETLRPRDRIASVDLRPAGDPGLHREA